MLCNVSMRVKLVLMVKPCYRINMCLQDAGHSKQTKLKYWTVLWTLDQQIWYNHDVAHEFARSYFPPTIYRGVTNMLRTFSIILGQWISVMKSRIKSLVRTIHLSKQSNRCGVMYRPNKYKVALQFILRRKDRHILCTQRSNEVRPKTKKLAPASFKRWSTMFDSHRYPYP